MSLFINCRLIRWNSRWRSGFRERRTSIRPGNRPTSKNCARRRLGKDFGGRSRCAGGAGRLVRGEPEVKLKIDPDRANLSGITNRDVVASATAAMSGTTVTTLREGNRQIPVVARLKPTERAQLSDVENLYVYSSQGQQKVPLR